MINDAPISKTEPSSELCAGRPRKGTMTTAADLRNLAPRSKSLQQQWADLHKLKQELIRAQGIYDRLLAELQIVGVSDFEEKKSKTREKTACRKS